MDIMTMLFDQETVMKNHMAAVTRDLTEKITKRVTREVTREVDKKARADERRKSNLAALRNLMETLKLSASEAMSAMKIPPDQQAVYAAQL